MRRPFAKLMEMCREVGDDSDVTLGELARRWDEEVRRIADAIDANKVVDGERGYIG